MVASKTPLPEAGRRAETGHQRLLAWFDPNDEGAPRLGIDQFRQLSGFVIFGR